MSLCSWSWSRTGKRSSRIHDASCLGSSPRETWCAGVAGEKRTVRALVSTFDRTPFADYEFAKGVLSKVDTRARTVLFSPATPAHHVSRGLEPRQLASWILEERLPVRLQLQLHKLIWPGRERGI